MLRALRLRFAAADRFGRTGCATADEVATADLDPAARAGWSADQWLRAEAAGLVALASAPQPPQFVDENGEEEEDEYGDEEARFAVLHAYEPIWEDDDLGWVTDAPPPEDFDGAEIEDYGHYDYRRTLTEEEEAAWEAPLIAEREANRVRDAARLRAYLEERIADADLISAEATDVAARPADERIH